MKIASIFGRVSELCLCFVSILKCMTRCVACVRLIAQSVACSNTFVQITIIRRPSLPLAYHSNEDSEGELHIKV